ncbi:MAG TPA: hypothetical protein PKV83_08000, partial [Methanothrix sp.]|nr:hypothetical protein [Methanothrix sp.]
EGSRISELVGDMGGMGFQGRRMSPSSCNWRGAMCQQVLAGSSPILLRVEEGGLSGKSRGQVVPRPLFTTKRF